MSWRSASSLKRNILVSCHYVYKNLKSNSPRLFILDGSWYMPNSGKNAQSLFMQERLPTASFFDIDKIAANGERSDVTLPHMLPSERYFEHCMSEMGVSNDDHVCIYDQTGIFSACRVWYMFKLFGHDQVSVIDGGLPKWKERAYPIETGTITTSVSHVQPTKYTANFHAELVKNLAQVQEVIKDRSYSIIDARSNGRFTGKDPEPRQGNVSGHMPTAMNIPYTLLLNPNGTFKSESELRQIFNDAGLAVDESGVVEKPIISSCGSGITACVLLYGLNLIGVKFDRLNLYDASWAEYGNPDNNTDIVRDV
jgi:thiosulfate/3-mercaptopyruvate sulfurtransferase